LAELGGRPTHPSVVVCSAKSGDADRARAADLGADEYVTKPFEPDDLVEVIRAVLARHAAAV
jgi:two-component system response regulator MtrA